MTIGGIAMTETVTAPEAEAEGTEATEASGKSMGERIKKALEREPYPALHQGFIDWVKRESDGAYDLDPQAVLGTMSLYNLYRTTDEFKALKAEQPSGGAKEAPMPTTPEEAKAALAKIQKDKERRDAAALRAEERAKKI